jgi:hypothetical protein
LFIGDGDLELLSRDEEISLSLSTYQISRIEIEIAGALFDAALLAPLAPRENIRKGE